MDESSYAYVRVRPDPMDNPEDLAGEPLRAWRTRHDRRQQFPQHPRAQSFFDDNLEDALPQQPVGQHLLELLVLLLQVAQAPDVRVRHHPELLLPAVERLRRDV